MTGTMDKALGVIKRPPPLHSKPPRLVQPHQSCIQPPNEDIPRPVPPLPLNRVLNHDCSPHSPSHQRQQEIASNGVARSSSSSSSSINSNLPSPFTPARGGASPYGSQCPSSSSILTRSSLAYSIVHSHLPPGSDNANASSSVKPNSVVYMRSGASSKRGASNLASHIAEDADETRSPSMSRRPGTRFSYTRQISGARQPLGRHSAFRKRSNSTTKQSLTRSNVPVPSSRISSSSRHPGSRHSASKYSIFKAVPKPLWLQSVASDQSDVEEDSEAEVPTRKITDCGPLLIPPSHQRMMETKKEDTCTRQTEATAGHPEESKRNSDGIRAETPPKHRSNGSLPVLSHSRPQQITGSPGPQPARLHRRASITGTAISPQRPASTVKAPVRRSSVIAAQLSASQSSIGIANMEPPGEKQLQHRRQIKALDVFASPRRSIPSKMRTGVPQQGSPNAMNTSYTQNQRVILPAAACASTARRTKPSLRMASQEYTLTSSPRRSSVCFGRSRVQSDSERLSDVLAQLEDKSTRVFATAGSTSMTEMASHAAGGSYHGGLSSAGSFGGLVSARATVSPDTSFTARLSDASTTDKTFRPSVRLDTSRSLMMLRENRLTKTPLGSQRSIGANPSRTPPPPIAHYDRSGDEQTPSDTTRMRAKSSRPAGEPSIIDRVNSAKMTMKPKRMHPLQALESCSATLSPGVSASSDCRPRSATAAGPARIASDEKRRSVEALLQNTASKRSHERNPSSSTRRSFLGGGSHKSHSSSRFRQVLRRAHQSRTNSSQAQPAAT
eukprot:Blabericola_migrator_1__11289@NODE_665_length_6969_cov_168_040568_g485_i0_p1_GENE_NODE_665_length_6969_cov_168_040568_g485_i0NODE_665_length_6969_cov_168_040568_g485_i0_p1_ORF_typecomplete_len784_score69_35_NODE_665_length_6969_cov_168_040568_g485_i09553306